MKFEPGPDLNSRIVEHLSKIYCALSYGAQKEADELYGRLALIGKEAAANADLRESRNNRQTL